MAHRGCIDVGSLHKVPYSMLWWISNESTNERKKILTHKGPVTSRPYETQLKSTPDNSSLHTMFVWSNSTGYTEGCGQWRKQWRLSIYTLTSRAWWYCWCTLVHLERKVAAGNVGTHPPDVLVSDTIPLSLWEDTDWEGFEDLIMGWTCQESWENRGEEENEEQSCHD